MRKLSDEAYAEILVRQRAEVRAALEAWERWMGAPASEASAGAGESGSRITDGARGKRPEINVEQATRELDSLERKIRALEEKMARGGA